MGEAPTAEDMRHGQPFSGYPGELLNKVSMEAGLPMGAAHLTTVCKEVPPREKIERWILHRLPKKKPVPEGFVPMRNKYVHQAIWEGAQRLEAEIAQVQPEVIVAFGNLSLWALTGIWGVGDWRGSELVADWPRPVKLVPTYMPGPVLRQWELRPSMVQDLRRAAKGMAPGPWPRPMWAFEVAPSFGQTLRRMDALISALEEGPVSLSFDIETRSGHITCAGIAWSTTEAICIPFTAAGKEEGYWLAEEEAAILWALRKVLTHPNARVVGQNLLYDCQYTLRWWGYAPRVHRDTMISWHTAFSESQKALDYQASMICESYVYWKDDAKADRLKEAA